MYIDIYTCRYIAVDIDIYKGLGTVREVSEVGLGAVCALPCSIHVCLIGCRISTVKTLNPKP